CKRFPYLTPVTLGEGLLDLDRNLPDHQVTLVAPTACLVARGDLHPALTPLLLEAAAEVHAGGGYLEEPGEFPSPHRVDFPIGAEARRYFSRGPSLLYRYLPFRAAAWIDRVKLMLLPLITLLLPLAKAAPPVYRWRIRSKIYRWYRVLRDIDQKLKDSSEPIDAAAEVARLKTLDRELAEVSVPLSYMEEFYNLRLHIRYVQERLERHDSAGRASRRAA
ncbi:MAG: C4-dicarboxylate ABC transporter substrate-binding protein, partial [Planctomycetales bacterium]|nr:C4-dicarboxylate ABC transporter substrate-binding protein [Planctomycetales bacterium]